MAYSFTEKKRIRKDFGKRSEHPRGAVPARHPARFVPQVPAGRHGRGRARRNRPACRVQERVPDRQLFGQRAARVRELPARRAGVRRQGVPAPRPHLRRAAAREGAPRRARQGSPRRQEAGEGHPRAGGLPGRTAPDDRQRHVRRERHRARHRLAAAPQPGRVLRPRPWQDAQLRQAAVQRARHSLPRLVARLRVRRQGLRLRAHRPPPQAGGHHPAARAGLQRRADARPVLREEHVPPVRQQHRDGAGAEPPARRDRGVRDQGAAATRSSSRKAAASLRATCARWKTPASTA